ncbi:MAG: hypothetical protein MJZ41_09835 [Bacteroidaceae bacterium]|nr:hypothetical protein [Bacteroidaceae bacterium]
MKKILSVFVLMLLSALPLVIADAKEPKAKGKNAKVVLSYYTLNTMYRMTDGTLPKPDIWENKVDIAKDSVVANLLVKKIKKDVITFKFVNGFYSCEKMPADSIITLERGSSLELQCRGVTDATMKLTVKWPKE